MPHVNREVDGRRLVDRRLLAFTTGYSVAAIRKHLEPDAYDDPAPAGTGCALYDRDRAVELLEAAGVLPRPDRRGPRRHVHDARPGRVA